MSPFSQAASIPVKETLVDHCSLAQERQLSSTASFHGDAVVPKHSTQVKQRLQYNKFLKSIFIQTNPACLLIYRLYKVFWFLCDRSIHTGFVLSRVDRYGYELRCCPFCPSTLGFHHKWIQSIHYFPFEKIGCCVWLILLTSAFEADTCVIDDSHLNRRRNLLQHYTASSVWKYNRLMAYCCITTCIFPSILWKILCQSSWEQLQCTSHICYKHILAYQSI